MSSKNRFMYPCKQCGLFYHEHQEALDCRHDAVYWSICVDAFADKIKRFKDDPWLIAIAQSGDFELAKLYMEAKQHG